MAIPLTKDLLTKDAEKFAEKVCKRSPEYDGMKEFAKKKEDEKKKNSINQIRKFYDEFVLLKAKADHLDEENFEKTVLPLICFAKAKIAYAVARDVVTEDFRKDMDIKISAIASKEDFENFMNFYQAFICYATYKYEEMKKNKQQTK